MVFLIRTISFFGKSNYFRFWFEQFPPYYARIDNSEIDVFQIDSLFSDNSKEVQGLNKLQILASAVNDFCLEKYRSDFILRMLC